MKLTNCGPNQTVISFHDSTEIFFSYDQPVAGFHKVKGWFRTDKQWSTTTSRHINKYLGTTEACPVSQDWINKFVNEIGQSEPADLLLKQKAEAYDVWVEKTNWVQEQINSFPVHALGKHRADVMREEIIRLRSLLKERAR